MEPTVNKSAPTRNSAGREVYGSFFLGDVELVIPVGCIQEVVNFPEKVIPVPLSPETLLGIFNLRGMIIPVLSLKHLLGIPLGAEAPARKVAIVLHEGIRIGLVFDRTSEILHATPDQVVAFQKTTSDELGVIKGALRLDDGGRILQILDPSSLIQIKNIPKMLEHLKVSGALTEKRLKVDRRQCISFVSGTTRFALEIGAINEIIRVPELKSSVLGAAACIGTATLRGMVIPVIDFAKFLGIATAPLLSTADDAGSGEGEGEGEDRRRILITTSGAHTFGLLIQSVESIVSFSKDDIHPIPLFGDKRSELFTGMLMKSDFEDVILLNQNGLFSAEEIHELTKGHSELYGNANQAVASKKASRERSVFINFRLKDVFSVPIKEVSEIINYPAQVMTPPGLPEHVRGVANLRSNVVTIVDLRALFQLKAADDETGNKLLIIKRNDAMFGFVVDGVEDIASLNEADRTVIPDIFGTSSKSANSFIKQIVTTKDAAGLSRQFMIVDFAKIFEKLDQAS